MFRRFPIIYNPPALDPIQNPVEPGKPPIMNPGDQWGPLPGDHKPIVPKPHKPGYGDLLPNIDVPGIADQTESRLIRYLNDLLDSLFGEFRKFSLPIIGSVSIAVIFIVILIIIVIFKLL